jgi:hypothetical protein
MTSSSSSLPESFGRKHSSNLVPRSTKVWGEEAGDGDKILQAWLCGRVSGR